MKEKPDSILEPFLPSTAGRQCQCYRHVFERNCCNSHYFLSVRPTLSTGSLIQSYPDLKRQTRMVVLWLPKGFFNCDEHFVSQSISVIGCF